MNRRYLSALCALFSVASVFGCKVTFVNNTDSTVFAFDENYNIGNMIQPGEQNGYGDMSRHPSVILYMQAPGSTDFKKAFKVSQIACALKPADKIALLSAIVDGTLNKEIYSVIDFSTVTVTPACCMDHGSAMDHGSEDMALDAPISTTDADLE